MAGKESEPVLFIAGAGYLGTALAREALGRGWAVQVLTRNAERAEALRLLGCRPVLEDRLDGTAWHAQLAPAPDYVVNCVSSAGGGLDGYRASYLGGADSLGAWLRGLEAKGLGAPEKVLYTSSTGVYPQDDHGWVEEDDAAEPGEETRPGILREAEERILRLPGVRHRLVFRLGGLYGPERHYLIDQVRQATGPLSGSGRFFLNLSHRDDVVRAVMHALRHEDLPEARIYNVVDGAPAMKAEMVGWLAARMERPDPGFDGGGGGSALRQPRSRRISNRRIREELGWEPAFPDYREGFGSLLG